MSYMVKKNLIYFYCLPKEKRKYRGQKLLQNVEEILLHIPYITFTSHFARYQWKTIVLFETVKKYLTLVAFLKVKKISFNYDFRTK